MGRPVMLTLEDKDIKGFTWAIAPALTSLGYLLILLVAIFPFWVRLVNEESREVFFSGLFENCFHIKCWRPRPLSNVMGNKMEPEHSWGQSGRVRALVPGHMLGPEVVEPQGSSPPRVRGLCGLCPLGSGCPAPACSPSPAVYIILGRVFLLSAVVLSFLTTLIMVSFASQLFPRTRKHNFVSAFFSFLTGACALLALLLHALEIQSLTVKPSPPQFSVQWPYYVLGFGIFLFIVAGAICLFQETACLRCHLLPISQNIEETEELPHLENLESLGGGPSSIQKKTLLKEETVI